MFRLAPSRVLAHVDVLCRPIQQIVLEQYSARPLGRPHVAISQDRLTAAVSGLAIGYGNEAETYLEAVECSILPKVSVQKEFPELKHRWTCCGVPETLEFEGHEAGSDQGLSLSLGSLASRFFIRRVTGRLCLESASIRDLPRRLHLHADKRTEPSQQLCFANW